MTPEEFKQIRTALALSQAALARLLVRDTQTISEWERRKHAIPEVVARRMRELATEKHSG